MDKKILRGLLTNEYEHPFDRNALNILEGTPGLETIVKKLMEFGIERLIKIQYTGSNIKVTPSNFKDLYKIYHNVAETLDLYYLPELYITWGYEINASAIGAEKPIVVLNSGCLDLLEEDELRFIIGHELGHIKSQHMLYHTIAQYINVITSLIGNATLGMGQILSYGIQIALLQWQRMSEYTCDRAGLLSCQSTSSSNSVMVKMSGTPLKFYNQISIEEFIKQANEFEELDYNAYNKIVKLLSTMDNTHPWTVLRSAEVNRWVMTGKYEELLDKSRIICVDKPDSIYCGNKLKESDIFCTKCGSKAC